MNTQSFFIYSLCCFLLVILFAGCIPSLHPLYTDDTRITDDRLLGTWTVERRASDGHVMFDVQVDENLDDDIDYFYTTHLSEEPVDTNVVI